MHRTMVIVPRICIFMLLLLTTLTSVHAFELDAPKTLTVNENATITLLDTGSETYDVKIFIGDAVRPTSRIFSSREGWKDARYYLLAALPDQTEFVIQSLQTAESAQLCARLRKSSSSSYRQECVSVAIENRTQSTPSTLAKPTTPFTVQPAQPPTREPEPSPIFLTSSSSSPSSPTFSSRAARVEQGIIIATILVILIGILLLVLRK